MIVPFSLLPLLHYLLFIYTIDFPSLVSFLFVIVERVAYITVLFLFLI